ncbi:heme-binding protein [Thiomicrospira microaerophila]|uniref:GlcG/HbpS family heme-binding protein n=1 Tax=Thiomicrospira microaerophila TaxID=406020 RepID=UPI00201070F3|nr:heme-binding protein [Thiomicrospira microaerophila]UQB42747.1 heme-binding protein [Thiomicrospira microaerophila]
MLKKTLKAALLSAGLVTVAAPVVHADSLVVEVPRLTLEVNNKIAMETIKACEAKGIPVSVTVVDRNGIIMVKMRDSMAPPVSLPISEKKAYTAVMFNANGSQLTRQAEGALPTLGEGLAFMAGSVTISAGGRLFGAVGVSGAPDGMVDEECAAAGVEAVQMDLEMM